jgi:transcriptional regulator with XRE-family HTH domain
MEFGKYLKELRGKTISQRGLAKIVGVSFTYLSKVENAVMPPPSEEVLIRIASALGVESDEIIIAAKKVPSDFKNVILEVPEIGEILRLAQKKEITKEKWRKIIDILNDEESE